MTLNLAQRSSKVMDFATNRKRVYIFLLVVNSNLDLSCTVSEIGGLYIENRQFLYPTPISAKIWGCSVWSRSVMLGSAESETVRLISLEIIFQEFEP